MKNSPEPPLRFASRCASRGKIHIPPKIAIFIGFHVASRHRALTQFTTQDTSKRIRRPSYSPSRRRWRPCARLAVSASKGPLQGRPAVAALPLRLSHMNEVGSRRVASAIGNDASRRRQTSVLHMRRGYLAISLHTHQP
jgi:hypothetical protein